MKEKILRGGLCLFGLMILAGFFLPWVKVRVMPSQTAEKLADQIGRMLGDDRGFDWKDYVLMTGHDFKTAFNDPFEGVSGFQIPASVHEAGVRGILSRNTVEMFLGQGAIPQKSLLFYIVPLLALAGVLLGFVGLKKRSLYLIPIFLNLLIYLWVRHQLSLTDFSRSVNQIRLGPGLWLCLYGLLFLSFFLIIPMLLPGKTGGKSKAKPRKN
ncbi:MAG: hypothetical protein SFY92_10055 [Verrucomicrobiae bacterium]|nr:hypothetical protein [Verrucomicrobiae bacterium]